MAEGWEPIPDVWASKVFITVGTYTINGGYFVVVNSKITLDSIVLATVQRGDEGVWAGYTVYPRINTAGEVYLFVRDMNGSYPEAGTKIKCAILAYTP